MAQSTGINNILLYIALPFFDILDFLFIEVPDVCSIENYTPENESPL